MTSNYLENEFLNLLKNDDQIFQFLEEFSLDGIWFWDIENPEHEWMSPNFWITLGVDPDTKDHKSSEWQNIIHPDDLKIAVENFNKHCADPTHPYDQVVRYTHSNGSTVWIRCRGFAIRDDQGIARRMLGAHNDITELMNAQSQTEEALQKQIELEKIYKRNAEISAQRKTNEIKKLNTTLKEEYLTQDRLLASVTNAILVVSTDREIAYSNQAAHDLFGYSKDEFKGLKIDALIDKKLNDQHINYVAEYFKKPFSRKMGGSNYITGIAKSGNPISLDIDLKPISFKGAPAALVNIVDVTERANTEQSMIASYNKLDSLIKILAHDLRDPLSRIVTSIDFLEEMLANHENKRVSEYLDIISQTANHSASLIKDLYEYASTHSDENTHLEHRKVGLQALAEQAISNLNIDINQDYIEIKNGLDDREINTVSTMLIQIMQNILANALKYCSAPISINIFNYTAADKLVIVIEDNGPGIPFEKRKEIFDPFVQLINSSNQNEDHGLGLGLSTCKNLVEVIGGDIWCEASSLGGSRFCISLKCQ